MNAAEGHERFKIAVVVSDGKRGPTATQMISFEQPFAAAPDATFRIVFEKDYAETGEIEAAFASRQPDILVLSRYTSERGRTWIDLARNAGIPVIFHLDDDLLAVPASLGEAKFKAYNRPERLQALRDNIEGSDLLYLSTAELASRFRGHNIATPMIAGDVYCAVAPDQIGAFIAPATGPVIGYMGTGGHSADLSMIMPAICEAMQSIPNLQFEVFGTVKMPAELEPFGRRVRHVPPVAEYSEFLPFLRSLGWWVGLAPLEDNAFNRCKADTKWVEYSLAGMAVVASDLPVYHRACAGGTGILAGSTREWTEAIGKLVYEPRERKRMVAAARAKLRAEYTHQSLRQQVLRIFEKARALQASNLSGATT